MYKNVYNLCSNYNIYPYAPVPIPVESFGTFFKHQGPIIKEEEQEKEKRERERERERDYVLKVYKKNSIET